MIQAGINGNKHDNMSPKSKPPRVCAKTLDAILNYHLFFVYLWKETKQYVYELHSRRKQKSNSNDSS